MYYAREPGIEPDSYASKTDGTWLQNVQPPIRISNLTPHVWHLVVTAVHPSGESAPSGEISAFAATQPLNDTGIDWCADGSQNNLDCPVQGYEGQDGDHGRDALSAAASCKKSVVAILPSWITAVTHYPKAPATGAACVITSLA